MERLADQFDLSQEERAALLPSGRAAVFYDRVSWARTYMRKAGLLESPRRGWMQITPQCVEVLRQGLPRLDLPLLERIESFRAFRAQRSAASSSAPEIPDTITDRTPQELLEQVHGHLQQNLSDELLEQVKRAMPAFFEKLVVELLVAMGYGGTFAEAAQAVGRPADEGIDGVINEDRLGLDVIYLQAKKWEALVSRPEIQKFVGALHGRHARKGGVHHHLGFYQRGQRLCSRHRKQGGACRRATPGELDDRAQCRGIRRENISRQEGGPRLFYR